MSSDMRKSGYYTARRLLFWRWVQQTQNSSWYINKWSHSVYLCVLLLFYSLGLLFLLGYHYCVMRLLFWRGASILSNIIHVRSVTAHKNEVTLSVPYVPQHNADAGATDHSCSICGKCLSSASSLDRHMLVHSGERPYKCNICGQTFTTNGNMHRWSERTHTRPATCQPIGDEHLIRLLEVSELTYRGKHLDYIDLIYAHI